MARWWRWLEFAALYVGAPVAMALLMPPSWLPPVFLGVVLAALLLLALTPGFRWRGLRQGGVGWGQVAALAAVTAVASGLLVWWLVPEQALGFPRRAPGVWLMVMALYPLLSALPQELVFRALFFRRYGDLLGRAAVPVNAAVFALAHLLFWNWVAVVLTLAGGAIFAGAYLDRGFPQAVVLHGVAGAILFTSGLGVFFFHGAVGP